MINLEDRFFTSTEVAEILGVSLRSVYRYLEEDKINAEVKTATGRHRFTKQNIIDFLYPNQRQPQMQQSQQQFIPQQAPAQAYTAPQQSTQQYAPTYQQPVNTDGIVQTQISQQTDPGVAQVNQQVDATDVTAQSSVPEMDDSVAQNPEQVPATAVENVTTQADSSEMSYVTPPTQTGEMVSSTDPATTTPTMDQTSQAQPYETPTPVQPQSSQTTEVAQEIPATGEKQVDWLAKFKEAADKYKQEQATKVSQTSFQSESIEVTQPVQQSMPAPSTTQPVQQSQSNTASTLPQHAGTSDRLQQPVPQASPSEMYYRSSVGGLKDIAQAVDKSAKKSAVPYAFTMNAGLSLHKPIKPFSVLHVYVRPSDKDFFERALQLAPSSKESAQISLKFTDDGNIYGNSEELHGLSVVSSDRLKKDLNDAGEIDLAKEI